jgi:hypothetical protein
MGNKTVSSILNVDKLKKKLEAHKVMMYQTAYEARNKIDELAEQEKQALAEAGRASATIRNLDKLIGN